MDESNRHRVHLDRRASPRAEYRRTAPALLELGRFHCAVRDLGVGGLRVEPAPPARVWLVSEPVAGELVLRTGGRVTIEGSVYRINGAGLAILPRSDCWPTAAAIDLERAALLQGQRERRRAPRLPFPAASNVRTPLRDVSTMGLRYALAPREPVPAVGSRVAGTLRLDAELAIPIEGRVVRHVGREIAVALEPPGLDPGLLARLRRRFLPETQDSA
jgi:PilZ domain-containing protein